MGYQTPSVRSVPARRHKAPGELYGVRPTSSQAPAQMYIYIHTYIYIYTHQTWVHGRYRIYIYIESLVLPCGCGFLFGGCPLVVNWKTKGKPKRAILSSRRTEFGRRKVLEGARPPDSVRPRVEHRPPSAKENKKRQENCLGKKHVYFGATFYSVCSSGTHLSFPGSLMLHLRSQCSKTVLKPSLQQVVD